MGKRGFTLIELLVVIAIIAILAAILFPVFAKAREKARQTSCLSNVKQLDTTFHMYAQDYDEAYPGAAPFDWALAGYPTNQPGHWVAEDPGTGSNSIIYPDRGAIYPYSKNVQIYLCPSDRYADTKHLSYSMNANLGYARMAILATPSTTVLLVDESETLNDGYFAPPGGSPPVWGDVPSYIHNGGANFAFCDGHAKWQRVESVSVNQFLTSQ